jgi:carbamoyltransferase
MTYILGINAFHADAAACLFRDGELIAAIEEERLTRIKHWAGFPAQSIAYCLEAASILLNAVDHVAVNRNPYANLGWKMAYVLTRAPAPSAVLSRIRARRSWAAIGSLLKKHFPQAEFKGQIHQVAHHRAHLASAFYASPYENAVAVSIDGFGDFASTAWGIGRGCTLRMDGQVRFPHSLGIFYQSLTQYLGFPHYGDEYKVMGLAPYGTPRFAKEMRQIVRLRPDGSFHLDLRFFRHHFENFAYEWNDGSPLVGVLYSPALESLLGPSRKREAELEERHKDIARSVQSMFEEAVFHLLNRLHRKYKSGAIVLAGGCAFNSVANGKILTHTPFERIYIQPAAGDAGGAIGAAYSVWYDLTSSDRRFEMSHPYWGPEFSDSMIAQLLDGRRRDLEQACTVRWARSERELCGSAAQAIADGKVVGWFQGKMEWGPRALGNRSICCDPRRRDMKELLNKKIKRRESFRPFAPSVLREAVREWFEIDDDVPFMMKVYQIRSEKRERIPAVTHVDGSGRLQTVERTNNPRYYHLIREFESLTGVPMILNTSFNENEPVVCRPDQALNCFFRTKMDVLCLGNAILERQDSP